MQNEKQPVLLVLGSLNLDLVLNVARMPEGGETLASENSATFCGGKGANQAVACARMGAPVSMIGRVGDDPAASMLRTALDDEGVDLDAVMTTPDCASGIAVVMLTPDGENRIVLAAGANDELRPDDVAAKGGAFDRAGMLVCQLETPLETIMAAASAAASRDIRVLLNPAPARALPADLLDKIDYLVPNELEAATLTGIAVRDDVSAEKAARALLACGVGCVVLTRGAAGITIADVQSCRHMPAMPTDVVDTTAAGDSFIGGFATGIFDGLSVDDAARQGLAVARLCVSRAGAQASLPYRREL